jgi:hypothetical protein
MSLRRPQVLKSKANRPSPSKSTDSPAPPTGLVPLSEAPRQRGPYGASHLYRQPDVLLHGPGGPFTQYIRSAHSSPQKIHSDTDADGTLEESSGVFDGFLHTTSFTTEDNDAHHNRARRKKANQWKNWTHVTIPSLIKPYLSLLHRSDTLSRPLDSESFKCSCGDARRRRLTVSCVYFESQLFPAWYLMNTHEAFSKEYNKSNFTSAIAHQLLYNYYHVPCSHVHLWNHRWPSISRCCSSPMSSFCVPPPTTLRGAIR